MCISRSRLMSLSFYVLMCESFLCTHIWCHASLCVCMHVSSFLVIHMSDSSCIHGLGVSLLMCVCSGELFFLFIYTVILPAHVCVWLPAFVSVLTICVSVYQRVCECACLLCHAPSWGPQPPRTSCSVSPPFIFKWQPGSQRALGIEGLIEYC